MIAVVVQEKSCFKKRLIVKLGQDILFTVEEEDRWDYALKIAELVYKGFLKGKQLGLDEGRKNELERNRVHQKSFYDL